MILAIKNGERITANPNERAECPSCGQVVIAKCGAIKVWHWAHIVSDCDAWSEPLTEWHIEWQNKFEAQWREQTVVRGGEFHRADVCAPNGIVVEFQHSAISPMDVEVREKFYGLFMRWVFDARKAFEEERLTYSLRWGDKGDLYVALRWKHPRATLGFVSRPLYLDIGHGLLLKVMKLDFESPCHGWGYLANHRAFIEEVIKAGSA